MAETKKLIVPTFNANNVISIVNDAINAGRVHTNATALYHHRIEFEGSGLYQGGNAKTIKIIAYVITNKKEAYIADNPNRLNDLYYVFDALNKNVSIVTRGLQSKTLIIPGDILVEITPSLLNFSGYAIGTKSFNSNLGKKWPHVRQSYPGETKVSISIYEPDGINLLTGKMKDREDLMISSDVPISSATDVVTEL